MINIATIIADSAAQFAEGILEVLGKYLFNLLGIGLYPEKALAEMGFTGLEELSKVFFYTGISLLVFKFLKKGFEIYILGTDGDPDSEPIVFLVNFFKAMAIALTFNEVYEWFANIISNLTDKALESIGLAEKTVITTDFIDEIFTLVDGISAYFFIVIFVLIYMIYYIFFYIKFLKMGLQVLILRIGLPLACSGLMDADRGVFRPYTQKFLQVGLTILLQIVLSKLSIALILSEQFLWGFAALGFATNTPRFLQEFLIVSEGGNGNTVYKAQAGVRLAQTLRTFVR